MDRAEVIRLATAALRLEMQGRSQEAADQIQQLDGHGIGTAICAWIDTFISKVYPDHKRGTPLALRWVYTPPTRQVRDSGPVRDADQVQAPIRWAGQLISLRVAGDQEAFMDLLYSVPDGVELGQHVMALLNAVALGVSDPAALREIAARVGPVEEPTIPDTLERLS